MTHSWTYHLTRLTTLRGKDTERSCRSRFEVGSLNRLVDLSILSNGHIPERPERQVLLLYYYYTTVVFIGAVHKPSKKTARTDSHAPMITSMGTIDICLSAASSCIAKSSEGVTTRRRRRRRPGATGALAATSVFLTGLPDFGHSYAISSSSSSTRGAHAAFGATTTTTLQRAKTSLDLGDHLFGGGILVRGPGTRPRGRDTPCRWRAASLVYCNCFCRPGDTSSELSFAFARGGRAGIGNAGRPSCTMPLLCSFVEQDAAMLEEVVETGWQLDDIDTEAIGIGSQGLFLTPIPHAAGVAAAAPLEESAAVSRRQRSELESQWLEDLGQDVPFQFADMQQVCVFMAVSAGSKSSKSCRGDDCFCSTLILLILLLL